MDWSDNELTYMECQIGKEINLIVEIIDKFHNIIIKSIKKKYFD